MMMHGHCSNGYLPVHTAPVGLLYCWRSVGQMLELKNDERNAETINSDKGTFYSRHYPLDKQPHHCIRKKKIASDTMLPCTVRVISSIRIARLNSNCSRNHASFRQFLQACTEHDGSKVVVESSRKLNSSNWPCQIACDSSLTIVIFVSNENVSEIDHTKNAQNQHNVGCEGK